MNENGRPLHRPSHLFPCLLAFLTLIAFLISLALQQPVAAITLLLAGLLGLRIWRMERHIKLTTHELQSERYVLEVPRGRWGDLTRAINRLLRQQHLQQRMDKFQPAALPNDALQQLLNGSVATERDTCVAVVVARPLARHATPAAWKTLASMAQHQSQRYGALLQPCGDGILLVFGAFDENASGKALNEARRVAEALQQGRKSEELAIGIAVGNAHCHLLPGVGYHIFGPPIDQALRAAHHADEILPADSGVIDATRTTFPTPERSLLPQQMGITLTIEHSANATETRYSHLIGLDTGRQ